MKNEYDQGETDSSETGDALSAWVAERLARLMSEHGVPVRQQASLLNELCGLSPSQARRKLHGATWSFGEVLAVVRRFGGSLDQLFGDFPQDGVMRSALASATALQDATFLMDSLTMPCRARLGALQIGAPASDALLTARTDSGWVVGTLQQLASHGAQAPYYQAEQVLLTPPPSTPRARIAILDDDLGTSETLSEWFNASGYVAEAFTSGQQLLASLDAGHDAFVVDFMLAAGDSSEAIIKRIRQAQPDAPIILLTGKLRSGQVSEAEFTTLLRTAKVTFFEKPVRPSVLAATIEKELDQVANRQAG